MLRSGLKVLIVDDEAEVRSMLTLELELCGCIVSEAVNGKDGLAKARAIAPNFILSDVRMPQMDGIQMLDALRGAGIRTPIVLMSGFADVPVWETYARGADAFVAKPFCSETLVETLNRVLTPLEQRPANEPQPSGLSLALNFNSWADAAKTVAWGRGGLFAAWMPAGIRRDKSVSIRITVGGSNGIALSGLGIVRWVRPSGEPGLPAGAGIEVLSMQGEEASSLQKLLQRVEKIAFIPRSLGVTA